MIWVTYCLSVLALVVSAYSLFTIVRTDRLNKRTRASIAATQAKIEETLRTLNGGERP